MTEKIDEAFYERADAHIHLSNQQLKHMERGRVSASMMYGLARFNAWVTATDCKNTSDLAAARQSTIDYFVAQYKMMLEENLDDYIHNFNKYMGVAE